MSTLEIGAALGSNSIASTILTISLSPLGIGAALEIDSIASTILTISLSPLEIGGAAAGGATAGGAGTGLINDSIALIISTNSPSLVCNLLLTPNF